MTGETLWTQFRSAVLRAADLGPDYEEAEHGKPVAMEGESLMHVISRQVTEELIMVTFVPAGHGTPRQWAVVGTYRAWNRSTADMEIWDEPRPAFREEPVAFRWRSWVQGHLRGGHLVGWQYGHVIVDVSVQSVASRTPSATH